MLRLLAAIILPFLPFGASLVANALAGGGGQSVLRVILFVSTLAIPVIAGLMVRLVPTRRWLIYSLGFTALVTGALASVTWVGIAREDCLNGPEALAAAIPAVVTALWVFVVGGVTAIISRRTGSSARLMGGLAAGSALTIPVLIAAAALYTFATGLLSVSYCFELIDIFL